MECAGIKENSCGNPSRKMTHHLLNKLIDEATDDFLVSSDWEKNLQICEQINNLDDGVVFAKAIKRQLGSQSKRTRERTIELLQTGMQNNYWVVRGVHSPDVLNSLIDLIRSPSFDNSLKNQLLNLVRAWGEAYQDNSYGLPNFTSTFQFLRSRNFSFPSKTDDSNYSPPQMPQPKPVAPVVSQPRPNNFVVVPPARVPQQVVYQGNRPPVYGGQPYAGIPGQPYPVIPGGNVYAQPRQYYPQQGVPQPVAQQNPTAKFDPVKLAQFLSQQTLLQEIFQSVDTSIEDIKENETAQLLLNECKSAKAEIHKVIESVTDEIVLVQMLQFNDKMIEIEQTFDRLASEYQRRKYEPQPQQMQAPRVSSFAPIGDEIVLDLSVPISKPQAPAQRNPNNFFSDFNAPPPYQPPQQVAPPAANKDNSDDLFDQLAKRTQVPQSNPPPQYVHNPGLTAPLQPSNPSAAPPGYFFQMNNNNLPQPAEQPKMYPPAGSAYPPPGYSPAPNPYNSQPPAANPPFQNYLLPGNLTNSLAQSYVQPAAQPPQNAYAQPAFYQPPPQPTNPQANQPSLYPPQNQQNNAANGDPFAFLTVQSQPTQPAAVAKPSNDPFAFMNVQPAQPQPPSNDPFAFMNAQTAQSSQPTIVKPIPPSNDPFGMFTNQSQQNPSNQQQNPAAPFVNVQQAQPAQPAASNNPFGLFTNPQN